MASSSALSYQRPPRTGYAPQGPRSRAKSNLRDNVHLNTNAFAIETMCDKVYHNTVDIQVGKMNRQTKTIESFESKKIETQLGRKIVHMAIQRQFGNIAYAFDGKHILILPNRPDLQNDTVQIDLNDVDPLNDARRKTYRITITFSVEVDMKFEGVEDPAVISVMTYLNIILQQNAQLDPSNPGISENQSIFLKEGSENLRIGSPGQKEFLELRRGFRVKSFPALGRFIVIVSLSAGFFIRDRNLANFGGHSLAPGSELTRFLKSSNLLVTVRYDVGNRSNPTVKTGKLFVDDKSARTCTFDKDGIRTSIVDHFYRNLGKNIRNPDNVVIALGGANSKPRYPIEFASICPDQFYRKKADADMTSAMLKFSNRTPGDYLNSMRGAHQRLFQQGQTLNGFNITVNPKILAAQAYCLKALQINFGRRGIVKESENESTWNYRGKVVAESGAMHDWGIVYFATDPNYTFSQKLFNGVRSIGVDVVECREDFIVTARTSDCEAALLQLYRKIQTTTGRTPQILICVLPNEGVELYRTIKRVCDVDLQVASQCIVANKAATKSAQYWANIALKINVKLGGNNHYVNVMDRHMVGKTTMIMGADVTHPPNRRVNNSSIAAVVASTDLTATKYVTKIRPIPPRGDAGSDDIIPSMKEFTADDLMTFRKSTGSYPERIIIYRDGISDSQFNEVIDVELGGIKRACEEIRNAPDPNPDVQSYSPKITFVVVSKRHGTRFFPQRSEHGDKNGNFCAGYVVDKDITHPTSIYRYKELPGQHIIMFFAMRMSAKKTSNFVTTISARLVQSRFPLRVIMRIWRVRGQGIMWEMLGTTAVQNTQVSAEVLLQILWKRLGFRRKDIWKKSFMRDVL
ncbi:hypothetical protein HK098_002111 [Nowakowskiella sp. JEL0407]|nr:hypothetical protein HK098_002111 [Nowakowskiella sp. JEL0407]